MIQCLCQKFKDLTMKAQILIIIFFILLLALSLIGVTFFVQATIINTKISDTSTEISKNQDRQQIKNMASWLRLIITNQFTEAINQINQLSKFFSIYDAFQSAIQVNKSLEQCIPIEKLQDNFTFLQIVRFCSNYNPDWVADESLKTTNNFISLLDQYSLALNPRIIDIVVSQYYSQFPFNFYNDEFDITQEPWYIKQDSEQLFVVSPFRHQNISGLDISYAFKSLIIRSSLFIDHTLIPAIPYNFMLLDFEGKVIYDHLEHSFLVQETPYIYDQNITGFNKSDWENITDSVNHPNSSTLKLMNKLSGQLIDLYAIPVLLDNFILIVYSSITSIEEINQKTSAMQYEIFQQLVKTELHTIAGWLGLIFIQNILLWIIFRPIAQLEYIVKNHVMSLGNNVNRLLCKIFKRQKRKQNSLKTLRDQLLNVYETLDKSQMKKAEMCKIWEQFTYNKSTTIDLSLLKNEINQLPNQKLLHRQMIKLIQINMQQF